MKRRGKFLSRAIFFMAIAQLALGTGGTTGLDLSKDENLTNVFMPAKGHQGKIDVVGKATSKVPGVRYVVFANTTDSYDNSSPQLDMGEFFMTQKQNENIFSGASKVYVRRIVGSTPTKLDTGEKASFKVQIDPSWQVNDRADILGKYITVGEKVNFPATALISQATWRAIEEEIKQSRPEISIAYLSNGTSLKLGQDFGVEFAGLRGRYYRLPNFIELSSPENGVAQLGVTPNTKYSDSSTIVPDDAIFIEGYFGAGRSFENVSIIVRMDEYKAH